MRVSDFSFELPSELVAQEPAVERTASRLMVLSRATDAPAQHTTFAHLPEFIRSGDVLVVNRTRVVPARLFAVRTDGVQFEIFFLRSVDEKRFIAWGKPGKKLRPGNILDVTGGGRITFHGRDAGREGTFEVENGTVDELLERSGHVPLPPYIHRGEAGADRERYQTVFARERGSVAAPTAGLHFDAALLDTLRGAGVRIVEVTLHVGPGTFQPLFDEDVEANHLHAEPIAIEANTLREVALAKREGRRVIAVGTTATRALETAARRGWLDEPWTDRRDETDLFLYPGAQFLAVDALITNFHLPRSSLFMLVCAFMGTERALGHYRDAVTLGYRFFSYGDAMLIA
ncbi:MAG TPA: tRNA preQ1(34) S-adenosylmethionine ribosyltransferase-isomerase QueA [Candidatus Krumholzibacteria bacterium]